MTDFPIGWDMCRDCGLAHNVHEDCPECPHDNREPSTAGAWLCLDCNNFIAPIGAEDDEGRPAWELL